MCTYNEIVSTKRETVEEYLATRKCETKPNQKDTQKQQQQKNKIKNIVRRLSLVSEKPIRIELNMIS